MTLDEARQEWQQTIRDDGGYCPCCDKWGKMYHRAINITMARSIVWLANHTQPGGDYVDVPRLAPRFLLRSNQLASMKWWRMCERAAPHPEEDKKHSGMWRITDLGNRWANNLVRVPLYVWTYANEVDSYDGDMVTVSDIIDHFSYGDVMSHRYDDE
jgi:hypothetical protein